LHRNVRVFGGKGNNATLIKLYNIMYINENGQFINTNL